MDWFHCSCKMSKLATVVEVRVPTVALSLVSFKEEISYFILMNMRITKLFLEFKWAHPNGMGKKKLKTTFWEVVLVVA